MNRYVIFAGSDYYPQGGFDDFVADFSKLSDAIKFVDEIDEIDEESAEWCHIVDMRKKEKIKQFERSCDVSESNEVICTKWEEVSED